jgi:flagellar assembly protein FliH
LVEDPVITRGGCKVVTDTSQIDATLDSRLASLIAPLLAGARMLDDEETD